MHAFLYTITKTAGQSIHDFKHSIMINIKVWNHVTATSVPVCGGDSDRQKGESTSKKMQSEFWVQCTDLDTHNKQTNKQNESDE